jgi:DNA-binding NarL/FixJ family response regulator
MLHDVIDTIVGVEPDLRVIAAGVRSDAIIDRVERDRPDVVVLCAESDTPPPMCDELLCHFPRLAVVALEDRAQRASIYMMRPTRFRVSEISRTELVSAIRRAAQTAQFPSQTEMQS